MRLRPESSAARSHAASDANGSFPRIAVSSQPSAVRVADTEPTAPAARPPAKQLTILMAVPTLHAGAADVGAVDLVRVLAAAGHRAIVVSRGGRLQPQLVAAGGEFIYADMASKNPL